jgi:hypothetical protein
MSEKLVDAILAGCIPVYVGADPQKFGIPSDLYIKSPADARSVGQAVDLALELPHDEYLQKVKSWIELPETRKTWEAVEVFDRILRHIESELLS